MMAPQRRGSIYRLCSKLVRRLHFLVPQHIRIWHGTFRDASRRYTDVWSLGWLTLRVPRRARRQEETFCKFM